jgi:hypothetical protein
MLRTGNRAAVSAEIRIGHEFTAADLAAEIYDTPAGLVEARLVRGPSLFEIDGLLRTYTIDGAPCLGYELPHDPETLKVTQHGAEINGAVAAFSLARVSGIALRTGFKPPHPDLAVTLDGESAALEMTEARPEGAFTAALRDVEARLRERVASDQALGKVLARRRIGVGFAALPPTPKIPGLLDALVAWITAHDWDDGDPAPPSDATLSEYVTSGTGWSGADAERPIQAQWDTNAHPIPNGLALILGVISSKNRKTYDTSPLWLAVNANLTFDQMPAVKRAQIDPGQFDRIYITDGKDAVTLKRLREHGGDDRGGDA